MVTGPSTPHSEFMLDPAAPDGNPTESTNFPQALTTGFAPPPVGHDAHQLLDGLSEALGTDPAAPRLRGLQTEGSGPAHEGAPHGVTPHDGPASGSGSAGSEAVESEQPESGVLGSRALGSGSGVRAPLGSSGVLKPTGLGSEPLGSAALGSEPLGSGSLRSGALGSGALGSETFKAGEMFLGPKGLPTAAINVPEAPARRQRPGPPGQTERPAVDRSTTGPPAADRSATDRPTTERPPADRRPTDRAPIDRTPAERSSEGTSTERTAGERAPAGRPTNDRVIARRSADWPANDRGSRPRRTDQPPQDTRRHEQSDEQSDDAPQDTRGHEQQHGRDETGAHQRDSPPRDETAGTTAPAVDTTTTEPRTAEEPAADRQAGSDAQRPTGAKPRSGPETEAATDGRAAGAGKAGERRRGAMPRAKVRDAQLDDRYAAPREKLTAPATDDSPAVPPPPSYSALVGGAVPGDPTSTYSAIIGSRLRAMLPWQSTEDPIAPILRMHRQIHPTADVALLRRAYAMAEQMHRGQMRKSGEAFISHPIEVTEILADLGMDTTTLVAALLHDTVEDTEYTLGALERDFGGEVALLVDGVTKFDKMFYGADAEAETIRKMIVAAGRDVRVLVIKLADRLHNMRTLDARSVSSQVRIATATREVLIPLCERLGIQALKRELEDWVLRAVSPSGYAVVDDYVRQRIGWDGYLEKITSALTSDLRKFSLDATVSPRPRHLYSIWKDTVDGNYGEPHDLPRVVIIVEGPETDCYAALGAVHGKWRPVPGRFKDFIATPKNNNYKSLHTTVLGPEGRSLEVLIRTVEMHQAAEYGIVANFRYPHTAAKFGPASKAEQLDWLRRLLDWEAAASDPAQFIASLRCDLAEDQILVLTAGGGRPVLLPSDATPVDLAYILGADVGNRCIGARVNGRLIAVSSPLADGDTVEIITRAGQRDEFDADADAPARGPSVEWLEFVKTPHARLHISRWFEAHEAPAITVANKVRLGRLAIGLALRQQGRGLASDLPLVRLAPRLGYPDLETLLVAVADHARTAEGVVAELIALVDHSPR
jgi:GTP pyrophosphokinase